MKTISVSGKLGDFTLRLPTKIDEITTDYLLSVTKDIDIAPYNVLVGLVYVDKLNFIINTSKKSNNKQINCVPVFVKAGDCDSAFIKAIKTNEKLVVAGSDLAIGHHVASPYNKITIDNVVRLIAQDSAAMQNLWKEPDTICYFLEFKIIPASAIHGVIKPSKADVIQEFVINNTTQTDK